MKIYYDVNEITNTCELKCPFIDVGYKGETGTDCQVGSIDCQECKFCYGHNKSGLNMVFFNNQWHLKTMPYIKCMWGQEKPSLLMRMQYIWHHIKQYFK
jgi:hypothetical protein